MLLLFIINYFMSAQNLNNIPYCVFTMWNSLYPNAQQIILMNTFMCKEIMSA